MPPVGFELTFPVFELAKTVHALDRAATVIGERLMKLHDSYFPPNNTRRANIYPGNSNMVEDGRLKT
jgi:hypothetical protein